MYLLKILFGQYKQKQDKKKNYKSIPKHLRFEGFYYVDINKNELISDSIPALKNVSIRTF